MQSIHIRTGLVRNENAHTHTAEEEEEEKKQIHHFCFVWVDCQFYVAFKIHSILQHFWNRRGKIIFHVL